MSKTVTIIIKSGTMASMDSNVGVKLAQAFVEKGCNVNIFHYGEGVTCMIKDQKPKRFPNVGKILEELAKKGVLISGCETCGVARGFRRGMEIEGVKVGSLTNDLSGYIDVSDRVILVGR